MSDSPTLPVSLALWCYLGLVALPSSAVGVDHVIHISFDGLRGDLLETYLAAAPVDFPNFHRLVDEGATTFNARTDYSNTRTLPNHTTMLTGRPVDQPSGASNTTHHGYTDNGVPPVNSTVHNSGNSNLSYVASSFDVVHDNGFSTALYASKTAFSIFEQSYTAATGAPDLTGADNGNDKIDTDFITSSDVTMHNTFLGDMALSQYSYTFLHYGLLDGVGHGAGWESTTWLNTLQDVDQFILSDLFDLVENHVGLADSTVLIVTADHGGSGTGHGTATDPENYTIPLLVWGAGVAPNADLYELNPLSRTDPETGQPSYTAAGQPIRNGDTGNLALQLLGLGSIDGSTINAAQDLAVASLFAADFDANQRVDMADLSIWQAGYGSAAGVTKALGDANQNGTVAGEDFLKWQLEYGSGVVSEFVTVPETHSIPTLLIVATYWFTTFQRRKQSMIGDVSEG